MNSSLGIFHKSVTIASAIFLAAPLLAFVGSLFLNPYTALGVAGLLSYVWFGPALVIILLVVVRHALRKAGKERAFLVTNIAVLVIIAIDLIVFANVWRYA